MTLGLILLLSAASFAHIWDKCDHIHESAVYMTAYTSGMPEKSQVMEEYSRGLSLAKGTKVLGIDDGTNYGEIPLPTL